jgi:hypothetical protein
MVGEIDKKYYESAPEGSIAERLMIVARDKIFNDFMSLCRPSPTDAILDVGISDVVNDAANLLERAYPYPRNITAVGLGEALEFQKAYPEVRYQQIQPGNALPFADRQFRFAMSNAVLEHVGSVEGQKAFINEMLRVADKVFVTVPNRFFPVEHHTAIPFLQWNDRSFWLACKLLGKSHWSQAANLILMSRKNFRACCPEECVIALGETGLMLGPNSSNLFLVASRHRD